MAVIALNARCEPRQLTGRLLTGAGLALLPWMGYMAATMPPAKAAAWIALDALEAACLVLAGTRLARGSGGHHTAAAGAAALLLVDATTDLLTAAPGAELALAVAMAVAAEIPLAALCAVLARQPRTETVVSGAR
ncbi:hypothetical protein [Streptomyces sp. NPDC050738]|uniref:hypothetical protein n=1 Tax=Streptomyces sp. NPDC050738 TaxID=3154744 RepID=UPI003429BBF2